MMADEQVQNVENVQSITPLGEVLWAAREAKKFTVQDASNYLRFSVKQIVALEANAFSELPDATITRGFIRNYARYLGLDAEPLLASYRARVPQPIHESLYVKSDLHQVVSSVDNRPWLKYILGSILALLFLVAWLLYLEFMPKFGQSATEPSANVANTTPKSADPLAQQVMSPVGLDSTEPSHGVANSVTPTPTELQPLPPQSASVGTPQISTQATLKPENIQNITTLSIPQGSASFTEQTWMQVKDKTGNIVFESLSPANSVANFTGTPPFEVVVGNAKATTLTFLNKNVDLVEHTKNNVARVRLE